MPTETGFLHAESSGNVFERTPGGAARAFPIPSIQGTRTHARLRSRRDPDLVWLGLEDGVARIRRTATGWRDEGRVPGFEENVRALAEGTDGRIWGPIIGRGVFRLTPGETIAGTRAETFLITPGRPDISRVAAWGDDLVFTAAEGKTTVFKFDEAARAFVPFSGLPKLPQGLTIAGSVLGADQPDHLRLRRAYTRNEDKVIYRVGRDGTVQALPQRVHDAIDTVQSIYEESGSAGPVLWLGGPDGLMRIEVNRAFLAAPPYRTLLWTRGERVAPGAELPHERNALEFEFVAPRYSPTYPLTYQTRLIGDGDAWSEWSPQRLRSFNHLTEGGYRFEVRARDVDGNLSAPATLAFTILPPWWRTWWAAGGYLLALGGVVAGAVRWRMRALRAKNERLEKIVATRTDDLRRQNGELARLHKLELDEKISARLAAEKAQLDVLRYQLNPHFLFNSLTSIRSQIPPALGSARATLDRLADFCRLTLGGRQAEERTTVGEEIAMLRAYLDIEQTRMGELPSVEFSVEAGLNEVLMPRLLLLPLVENALKYGQATSEDMLGLKITARRTKRSRVPLREKSTRPSFLKSPTPARGSNAVRVRGFPRRASATTICANGCGGITRLRINSPTRRWTVG